MTAFLDIELRGSFYQHYALSLGSAPSRSLAPRPGIRCRIDFIRMILLIETTVSLKKQPKHFYKIILSRKQLVFIIVFYHHDCHSAIGHIFCNWRYINNLLTYLITYLLTYLLTYDRLKTTKL